jgi:hypothetical protein
MLFPRTHPSVYFQVKTIEHIKTRMGLYDFTENIAAKTKALALMAQETQSSVRGLCKHDEKNYLKFRCFSVILLDLESVWKLSREVCIRWTWSSNLT